MNAKAPPTAAAPAAAAPVSAWVRIGVVGRPHGIRGALKVHLDNPDSETLKKGLKVRLEHGARVVDDVVATVGNGMLTLEKVPDRTAAEGLVGALFCVQRADFVADEDAVYLVDFVGHRVVDVEGKDLGVIVGFTDNTAQPLAEVKRPDGKIALVPFVPPIVHEVKDDVVVMIVPEGLFDLDEE